MKAALNDSCNLGDEMESTVVWLIRHAQCTVNTGIITYDPPNARLTSLGINQCQYIADQFKIKPSLIVTSPYLRCRQTCYHTCVRFRASNVVEWPVYEFNYLSPIKFYLATNKERKIMIDQYWKLSDPQYIDGKGAESFESFCKRVKLFLNQIQICPKGFIVVFTHGLFIHGILLSIISDFLNAPLLSMHYFRLISSLYEIPNAGIIELVM